MLPADGRMPSIEREPKTLSLQELKYAREAALYVLSTHSSEDAVRIFTEGLQPVIGIGKNLADSDDDDDDSGDGAGGEMYDHRRAARRRDVVTAPF